MSDGAISTTETQERNEGIKLNNVVSCWSRDHSSCLELVEQWESFSVNPVLYSQQERVEKNDKMEQMHKSGNSRKFINSSMK